MDFIKDKPPIIVFSYTEFFFRAIKRERTIEKCIDEFENSKKKNLSAAIYIDTILV